ncbi:MAG: OmpA family protein [Bacteroidaceae bacterium]|nr:OmpA family protein [Bacteroidaceae bacterium]
MKMKLIALSVMLAGASLTANAQDNTYTEKWTDNIFFGFGVGGMSVINNGFNTPTLNLNVQLGKYITPTWGVRAEVSGIWQSLNKNPKSSWAGTDGNYSKYCKKFVETNFDAILNLNSLFGNKNVLRAVDVYVFAGPTLNFSSKGTEFTGTATAQNQLVVQDADKLKVRVGATAGLGLGFNVNEKWAINVEGRIGVTPSIFGDASTCRKAEATGRLTIGATYTFGGKNFKKVADRVIEKEVIREVPKEVIKEVVKEVKVEVPSKAVAAAAVFFKIGKSDLTDEGRVNIKLIADAIKKSPAGAKYQVVGSADKATGSASLNQKLSEKRAQVVYDALIAEGVSSSQLEVVAKGGVDPLFFDKDRLSRVTVIECK